MKSCRLPTTSHLLSLCFAVASIRHSSARCHAELAAAEASPEGSAHEQSSRIDENKGHLLRYELLVSPKVLCMYMPTGLPSQWRPPTLHVQDLNISYSMSVYIICTCNYVYLLGILCMYVLCTWVHNTYMHIHYTTLSKCCTCTWAIWGAVVLPVYFLYNTHLVRHQLGMGIVQHILNLFCSEVLLNCMMEGGRGEGEYRGDERKMDRHADFGGLCQLHNRKRWGKMREMVGGEEAHRQREETGRDHEAFWRPNRRSYSQTSAASS